MLSKAILFSYKMWTVCCQLLTCLCCVALKTEPALQNGNKDHVILVQDHVFLEDIFKLPPQPGQNVDNHYAILCICKQIYLDESRLNSTDTDALIDVLMFRATLGVADRLGPYQLTNFQLFMQGSSMFGVILMSILILMFQNWMFLRQKQEANVGPVWKSLTQLLSSTSGLLATEWREKPAIPHSLRFVRCCLWAPHFKCAICGITVQLQLKDSTWVQYPILKHPYCLQQFLKISQCNEIPLGAKTGCRKENGKERIILACV